LYRRYFRKKDFKCKPDETEWIEMTGQEFYRFVNSPAGQGRYFIDMSNVVLEATKEEARVFRSEQDHSDYLKEQAEGWSTLSLYTGYEGNGEDAVKDESQDVEAEAIRSIEHRALRIALSYLDTDSFMLINALYLAEPCKTERELADELGLSQNAINKRKKKILNTLKILVVKIQKSSQ